MEAKKQDWRVSLAARSMILKELFGFLWKSRLWWLIPFIICFIFLGILIWFVQSPTVVPFIYSLF